MAEIDALWLAMAEIYGHRWVSAYGADSQAGAGATWAAGLAGINPRQLGIGIGACMRSADPWPPTLPEFRGMCLGIPSLAFVRDDLTRAPQHRSPFTVHLWSFIDGYRYRMVSADQADRMIRDAYELAREHVMRGGALPQPADTFVTEEKRAPVPASPEVAAASIAEAKRLLGDHEEPKDDAIPDPTLTPAEKEAIENELRTHYSDRKSAAAGGDQ